MHVLTRPKRRIETNWAPRPTLQELRQDASVVEHKVPSRKGDKRKRYGVTFHRRITRRWGKDAGQEKVVANTHWFRTEKARADFLRDYHAGKGYEAWKDTNVLSWNGTLEKVEQVER